MFHYNKLRGRIIEKYGTLKDFAANIGTSYVSVSKKICGKTGFSQEDIVKWSEYLDIKPDEYSIYFFA